jgi:hypothetical protein
MPGGMVFVHYFEDGRVALRQVLGGGIDGTTSAAYAAEECDAWVAQGHVITLHCYDGDTGELTRSAIADRDGRRLT